MPSRDTYRSPARPQRRLAALAILVTIGIAFVALIVFLGGTRPLVTALLAAMGTAAITALAVLFMRRRRRPS